MADHQDLLDAIARIRAATGDPNGWTAGLSGEDIAVATNPLSPPAALGAVLATLIATHPALFRSGPLPIPAPMPAPTQAEGAAAEAIGDAERVLAQQNSTAAQIDLQVLAAVLNAHATHGEGVAALDRLQREIEHAVAARADLGTPAGARAFQRYLVDRLRDIHTIVEAAGLDSTSKAALAAALGNLYASSGAEPVAAERDRGGCDECVDPDRGSERGAPIDATANPLPALGEDLGPPVPADPLAQPVAPPMPALPPAGWGGGLPAAAPSGGAIPAPSPPAFSPGPLAELFDRPRREFDPFLQDPLSEDRLPEKPIPEEPIPEEPIPEEEDPEHGDPVDATTADPAPADPASADPASADPATTGPATTVELPGGETVTAPSPELAAVITAAVAGTPIPEAFRQQGIALPDPATAVTAPVDASQLAPGDIGLLTDRHALALGNGKALLDQQIQSVAGVTGRGFLGWQHPPAPQSEPVPTPPEPPAPIPSAQTAPS